MDLPGRRSISQTGEDDWPLPLARSSLHGTLPYLQSHLLFLLRHLWHLWSQRPVRTPGTLHINLLWRSSILSPTLPPVVSLPDPAHTSRTTAMRILSAPTRHLRLPLLPHSNISRPTYLSIPASILCKVV